MFLPIHTASHVLGNIQPRPSAGVMRWGTGGRWRHYAGNGKQRLLLSLMEDTIFPPMQLDLDSLDFGRKEYISSEHEPFIKGNQPCRS